MLNKKIINKNISKIITHCGQLKRKEKVLILFDKKTLVLARIFKSECKKYTKNIKFEKLKLEKVHGVEPSIKISTLMSNADLIIGLTTMSIIHTKSRKKASQKGARYLSLPLYNFNILKNKAFKTNFKKIILRAKKFKKILDKGKKVKVLSNLGTEIVFNISKRLANDAPGICYKRGSVASPPDAEVNIAPVENSKGIIVIDGCIPIKEIGKLKTKEPITLEIKNGKISKISGRKSKVLEKIYKDQKNKKAKIIGELGFGLNPNAHISGEMLIDEGIQGTVHFGMGLSTEGGKNEIPFHLDHVILKPNVFVDNKKIINNGKIII